MVKKIKKLMKNEKGLTLIELLAVIVILGIVAAIAVPAIGNIINNSKDKALLADAVNILAGAKIAMVDGACISATSCTKTELDKGYVENIKTLDGVTLEYSAAYDKATNAWTVTYSNLTKLNNTDFKIGIESDGKSFKESALNAVLQ